jgi:hypothetical protein
LLRLEERLVDCFQFDAFVDILVLSKDYVVLGFIHFEASHPVFKGFVLLRLYTLLPFIAELGRTKFEDKSLVHHQVAKSILVLFNIRSDLSNLHIQLLNLLFLFLPLSNRLLLLQLLVLLFFVVVSNERV